MNSGEDGPGWLAQELLEYAGFALFHAGSLLPREAATALDARASDFLRLMRQPAETGRPLSRRKGQGPSGEDGPGRDTQR